MLMPECTENVTCVALGDGMSEAVYEPYVPPNHAVCRIGPPAYIECANGYTMSENGTDCISQSQF